MYVCRVIVIYGCSMIIINHHLTAIIWKENDINLLLFTVHEYYCIDLLMFIVWHYLKLIDIVHRMMITVECKSNDTQSWDISK